jgi:hypothetical protein
MLRSPAGPAPPDLEAMKERIWEFWGEHMHTFGLF